MGALMETVHDLKSWPDPFRALVSGAKKAEVRKNDRDFKVHDYLRLQEWDPPTQKYTGEVIMVRVTHIQEGFGIPEGFVVMSVK